MPQKNILLLGDSIRQNYDKYVQEKMRGYADVYYPNDNGRFCLYTLRYLHEWVYTLSMHNSIPFHAVHFNCGLWDVLRLSNEDNTFTSEKDYAKFLQRIIDRIKHLCPGAAIYFALTTEIIEPGFEPGISNGLRKNSDIRRFNEIATEICTINNIPVDDLWNFS